MDKARCRSLLEDSELRNLLQDSAVREMLACNERKENQTTLTKLSNLCCENVLMEVDTLEIVWRRLWSEIRDLQQRSFEHHAPHRGAVRQRQDRIEYLRRKVRKIRESLRN